VAVNAAGTLTRNVVVVSRDAELAALLKRILNRSNWHAVTAAPGAVADLSIPVDAAVVDVPPSERDAVVAQLRRHFIDLLIVIAQEGEGWSGLSTEDGIVLLTRPFPARELGAALGIVTGNDQRVRWQAAGPATGSVAPLLQAQPARRKRSPTWRLESAAGLITAVRHRFGRRLALVGTLCIVGFVGAFALAARSDCGAECRDSGNGFTARRAGVPSAAPAVAGFSGGRTPTSASGDPRASGPSAIRDGNDESPGAGFAASGPGDTMTTSRSSGAGATTGTPRITIASASTAPTTSAPTTTAPASTVPTTSAPTTTAPPPTAPTTTTTAPATTKLIDRTE
jgi:hypothetical protein